MNPIKFLSDLMIQAINFFYGFYPNYGVAIIFLTAAVKLALYPLTLQSLQQMSAMQKLQPKVKELQKELKDKPKELQEKTMELYKTEGVNPLGGCLPMLLQLPFFISLFFAIKEMAFTGPGSSFLWIADLSKPDPTYILVILIALSTYITQKSTPHTGDGASSIMLMFMPLFIAFISAPFPAGVQLFWFMQTFLTGLQQMYVLRKINGKEQVA